MYKIETFIKNFGREDFYKRFTEYKDACDILEEADGGFFTIEEEIYSAYETKKMYHDYFNSMKKLEDAMEKFINDTDISDLLISTEKELFSSIKKYYDSLTSDTVESVKFTAKTYEEIKSLISSIMEFKNSFKKDNKEEK
ncbi:MAG: hypothetical protein ACRC1T_09360 [Clostridium chrysemydis]|uniref:hypothetical protein n=1 Tax=Clostridium chrysemydis TaxID=2665504 RepID=UPI003F4071A1